MTNKPKAQGTKQETWLVKLLEEHGFPAKRIAEGGALDEGDVEALMYNERWVLESKARQNLNVQDTLSKTRKKATGAPVMVVWKRLIRQPGNTRRTPVSGEPVVVVLSPEDLFHLIDKAYQKGTTDATGA